MLHISLAAETVFYLFGLPVTNAMLTTWIVMALLFLMVLNVRSLPLNPSNRFHIIVEMLIEFFDDLCQKVAGKHGREFFPLVTSLFVFILVSNWLGLIPGVGTVGIYESDEAATEHAWQLVSPVQAEAVKISPEAGEAASLATEEVPSEHQQGYQESEPEHEGPKFVPLLRAPTSDLNTTFALAIVSMVMVHFYGMRTLGLAAHWGKFFNFSSGINAFVGLLELISDVSKIISFAFRLFGNIFAGEVLLAVVGSLISVPHVATLPFYGLEIFVGFIQAFVFAILTLVFLSLATSHH